LPEGMDIMRAQYYNDPFQAVVPPVYLSAAFGYVSDELAVKDDRGRVVRYSRVELLAYASPRTAEAYESLRYYLTYLQGLRSSSR